MKKAIVARFQHVAMASGPCANRSDVRALRALEYDHGLAVDGGHGAGQARGCGAGQLPATPILAGLPVTRSLQALYILRDLACTRHIGAYEEVYGI